MKKYLLPENGNFYKANLHCHTTISDGKLTPEEIKEHYKKNGYSIIAYTDHDVMVPHPELDDENFLALYGYEVQLDNWHSKDYADTDTCHICLIALNRNIDYPVASARTGYKVGNAVNYVQYLKFRDDQPDFEREYSVKCANQVFKDGREQGYFVTYNHPTWSQEGYETYSQYEGMHCMEIYNHGCNLNYFEYNHRVYDDLLKQGKRIYCMASDDTHCHYPIGHVKNDCCGGWVNIKADKLEYETITKALVEGKFYSSTGPEIKSLYIEDNKIFVETSPAKKILFTTARRKAFSYIQEDKPITFCDFGLQKEDVYVRVTVFDEFGNHADTNAYFVEEFL